MPSQSPTQITLNREQLECLASPLRKELLEALRQLGTASITELATFMERSPKSLYYHIHQFQRVGLVEVSETRMAGKREEAVYKLIAERFVLEEDSEDAGYVKAAARSVSALLRKVDKEFQQASEAQPGGTDEMQEVLVMRVMTRLNPTDLAQLRKMLREASQFAREHDLGEGGTRVALTSLLTSLPKRKERTRGVLGRRVAPSPPKDAPC